RVLEPVTEVEQLLAVAAQLAGELRGGHPLREAAEDQHQLDGPPLGPLQRRAGEGVEDPPAARAAEVQDRGAMAAGDAQSVSRPGAARARRGGRASAWGWIQRRSWA